MNCSSIINQLRELESKFLIEKQKNEVLLSERELWQKKELLFTSLLISSVDSNNCDNNFLFTNTETFNIHDVHKIPVSSKKTKIITEMNCKCGGNLVTCQCDENNHHDHHNHALKIDDTDFTKCAIEVIKANGNSIRNSVIIEEEEVKVDDTTKGDDKSTIVTETTVRKPSLYCREQGLKRARRKFIIKEFIDAERYYVKSLEVLEQQFLPLIRENYKDMSENNSSIECLALDELELVIKINKLFLSDLESLVEIEKQLPSFDNNRETIGNEDEIVKNTINNYMKYEEKFIDVIQTYVPQFRMYCSLVDHCQHLIKLVRLSSKRSENFRLKLRIITETLIENKSTNCNFESFLILPFKSLERYYNLLIEYFNCYPNEILSLEFCAKLENCISDLRTFMNHCNEKQKQNNDLAELCSLQKYLKIPSLVTPYRRIIKSSVHVQRVGKRGRIVISKIFLFNDLLVVRSPKRFRTLSYKIYKFHLDSIDKNGMPSVRVAFDDTYPNTLLVQYEDVNIKQQVRLIFPNENDSKKWLNLIIDQIETETLFQNKKTLVK
ncbi:hypothetical protein ABK040_006669 [Willaertia magna]